MQTACALATPVEQLESMQQAPFRMQPAPHFLYPLLHMKVQLPALHSGVALATPVEQSLAEQQLPVAMQLLDIAQYFCPPGQAQAPPGDGQVWLGTVQSLLVQQVPLAMQALPHWLKPPLQVKPHTPAVQVAVAPDGTGQEVEHELQCFGSVLRLVQVPPQLVGVAPGQLAA